MTTKQPGPQMIKALRYVQANPGCTKQQAALAIGPSQRFGYASVGRAIRAGLITALPGKRGYALWANQ